jgi:hypothetical protein
MSQPTLADILAHEMNWRRERLTNDLDALIRRLQNTRQQLNAENFRADWLARNLSGITSNVSDLVYLASQIDAYQRLAATTKQG